MSLRCRGSLRTHETDDGLARFGFDRTLRQGELHYLLPVHGLVAWAFASAI
ncbi:MAG: hypothetical protein V3R21_02205 [Woeseiaceae bacterium]